MTFCTLFNIILQEYDDVKVKFPQIMIKDCLMQSIYIYIYIDTKKYFLGVHVGLINTESLAPYYFVKKLFVACPN